MTHTPTQLRDYAGECEYSAEQLGLLSSLLRDARMANAVKALADVAALLRARAEWQEAEEQRIKDRWRPRYSMRERLESGAYDW